MQCLGLRAMGLIFHASNDVADVLIRRSERLAESIVKRSNRLIWMWPLTRIDPPLLTRIDPLKRLLNSATVLVG